MNNVYDQTIVVDEMGRYDGTCIGGFFDKGLADGEQSFHAPLKTPDRIVFPASIIPATGPYSLTSWHYMNNILVADDHCIPFSYAPNANCCISVKSPYLSNIFWIRDGGNNTALQSNVPGMNAQV